MSKKIFTVLLLAVFMLAQFSIASAAEVAGATLALTGPVFSDGVTVKLAWSASDLPSAGNKFVDIYARPKAGTYVVGECWAVVTIPAGTTSASGSYTYTFLGVPAFPVDQETWEFVVEVDDTASCTTPPVDAGLASNKMASVFIDAVQPNAFEAVPPSKTGAAAPNTLPVACNTFEFWGMASDHNTLPETAGYSGVDSWNKVTTGTFAPPAPEGTADTLLSWVNTFPASATGTWVFSVDPTDAAGWNTAAGLYKFRDIAADPTASELADCKDFSDTAGNANEVYVRYLGDLGLLAGNPDGTFGPDTTLTRAEAAVLYELANGLTATDPGFPTTAPSAACSFTDVAATDWFAGWVWAACDDGFVAGVGGGLFDPANTFTRGQAVTILNNIFLTPGASYFGPYTGTYRTVLNDAGKWTAAFPYRTAAFTDVSIGAYYANAVVRAYQSGVADATSETTFSPDQPILRGEFAKMLYRALSRVP